MNVIEKLSKTAAEKRAYRWMYGPGMGGGFGNPYMGGMGYGGFGGGMPMSYGRWGPYGGSFGGIDPRFADLYGQGMRQNLMLGGLGQLQGMRQQQQTFERQLPGIDIGLQGQQADLAGKQMDVASQNPLVQAGQMSSAWGHQEPQWQDMQQDVRGRVGQLATGQANRYQDELGKITDQIKEQQTMLEKAKSEAGAARQRAMAHMGARGQLGSIATANEGGSWNPLKAVGNMALGVTGWGRDEAQQALAAHEAYQAAQGGYDQRMGELRRRQTELQRQLTEEQGRQGQLNQLGQQAGEQSGARLERGRTATQNVQDTFRQGMPAMGRAGEIGTQRLERPVQPSQPQAPVQPRPAPQTQAPPQSPAPLPHPAPQPAAPGGAHGPHQPDNSPRFGGDKSPNDMLREMQGGAKMASLVELADKAARVQLERSRMKYANLRDPMLPGATTRTGKGMTQTPTANLIESIRKAGLSQPVMPQVAKTVAPKVDPSAIMQSLGLGGMPTSIAHLPVESAVGMGISAQQHGALRKALGLG